MGIDRSLFIDEIPADCLCAICQDVLDNPKETLTCQHAFCEECIMNWLDKHRSCPACRCPLSCNDLITLHRIWKDKLNKLQLHCLNSYVGCREVMPLYELEKHNTVCLYVRVSCPHSPCSKIIERGHIQEHVSNCNYRKMTCTTCHLNIPAMEFDQHECIPALRNDFTRQLEVFRHEWLDCLRTMQREQRHLEDRLCKQREEITELKTALTNLISHNRLQHKNIHHLPAIKVTGSGIRVSSRSNLPQIRGSIPSQSQRASQTSNTTADLSLPRLAPLHTRMSLSRNSGTFSGL